MADSDMNAEQGGFDLDRQEIEGQSPKNTGGIEADVYQSPEEAGTPLGTPVLKSESDDQQAIRKELSQVGERQPNLQFAALGPQFPDTGQYNARFGGGLAGRQPVPGGRAPEVQQRPPKLKFPKKWGIALGGLAAGGLAAVGAALGYDRLATTDDDPNTGGQGGVATEPVRTNTPDANTPVPTTTSTPEVTTTVAPETVTQVPEILGNGKYNTVEDMPNVTEKQIETINKFLKDSTPFIFVDGVIVAVDNDLMTRTETTDPKNTQQYTHAPQLHTVGLNIEDFIDSAAFLEELGLRAKYENYLAVIKDEISFEQYKEDPSRYSSTLWAFNGEIAYQSDGRPIQSHMPISGDSPVIFRYVSQREDLPVRLNTNSSVGFIVENGVVCVLMWGYDPGAIGRTDPNIGAIPEQYSAASFIAWGATEMSDTNIESAGTSTDFYSAVPRIMLPTWERLSDIVIPTKEPTNWNSIITATGAPANSGNTQ